VRIIGAAVGSIMAAAIASHMIKSAANKPQPGLANNSAPESAERHRSAMVAAKEPASTGRNSAISAIPGPSGLADPESSATAPAIENRNHQAMPW
jgi:hypothetical protein